VVALHGGEEALAVGLNAYSVYTLTGLNIPGYLPGSGIDNGDVVAPAVSDVELKVLGSGMFRTQSQNATQKYSCDYI
jgi:hypothetical protein